MSSFQALLEQKAREKAQKEHIIAQKRRAEEERVKEEKAAKLKKQKQDEEDAKRLRLLSRKKELEANDRAKKAAEEKAYLEQKREEERKRVIKDKILGPQKASHYSPMTKIKQAASHPSLARPASASSSIAPTPGTPGYASHRSHASSSSNAPPPVVLTRQERKALAEAREFGLTPGAKAASTMTRGGWREGGKGKMTLEEEGISKLAKLAAERAGLVPVPPGARANGKGKERESDSNRRTVGIIGKNGDKPLDRSGSTSAGKSGEGSSRRNLPLEPRKPRQMDRASSLPSRTPSKSSVDPRSVSSSSSRPTPRKRPRSPSPDSESSLDSDDLDRNERNRRRVTGKGRDRDEGRGSSSRGGAGAGGGILASLGFDPYQSFSRSGKDRAEYMRNPTYSDEESDMEANAATIAKEEARAARLAREQDRLEEELERKRKEEKLKRKGGK